MLRADPSPWFTVLTGCGSGGTAGRRRLTASAGKQALRRSRESSAWRSEQSRQQRRPRATALATKRSSALTLASPPLPARRGHASTVADTTPPDETRARRPGGTTLAECCSWMKGGVSSYVLPALAADDEQERRSRQVLPTRRERARPGVAGKRVAPTRPRARRCAGFAAPTRRRTR